MKLALCILFFCSALSLFGESASTPLAIMQAAESNELARIKLEKELKSQAKIIMENVCRVEQGALVRLLRHKTCRENFLYHKIQEIRQLAKTKPEKAEALAQAVIDQFESYGVTL